MQAAVHIAPSSDSRVWRVELPPDLDMDRAAELKEILARALDARRQVIVLDMSGVRHLDALPLTVIITAHRRAGDIGSELVLEGLEGQPLELIDEWAPLPPLHRQPVSV